MGLTPLEGLVMGTRSGDIDPAILEFLAKKEDMDVFQLVNMLNKKSDYCQKCGFDGEILIDDNLEWYCPECGNRDHNTLNVARRTCGYIGSNFWNKGRTQEIKERVLHIDNKDEE